MVVKETNSPSVDNGLNYKFTGKETEEAEGEAESKFQEGEQEGEEDESGTKRSKWGTKQYDRRWNLSRMQEQLNPNISPLLGQFWKKSRKRQTGLTVHRFK